MRTFINLAGQKFGSLTVQSLDGRRWLCLCDCGGTKVVKGEFLRNGRVKSCGCLKRNRGWGRTPRAKLPPKRPLRIRIAEQAAELMRWGVPEDVARVRAEQMCAPLHKRRGDTLAQIREVPRETRLAVIDEFAVSRPGA